MTLFTAYRRLFLTFSLLLAVGPLGLLQAATEEDELALDDAPLENPLHYPAWFQLSFLQLQEDLQEVRNLGKRGLIVYFGQDYCPYCKALVEGNFGMRDIEQYTQKYFDVVAIDIHGNKPVTNLNGVVLSEKDYAASERINFTPSLIFYTLEGREVLRLQGYPSPYRFRAALEYVADGHYREESFDEYLARANPPLAFEMDGLNQGDFFTPPPYVLDRTYLPGKTPLLVSFEQGNCHACDVLHSAPLQNPEIQQLLTAFESVQLDIGADTPVITPAGVRTNSRDWADTLGLSYTPTLVFFDEQGDEIIRVDSVVGFYRLRKVLEYVLSGSYKRGITLQQFRRSSAGRSE